MRRLILLLLLCITTLNLFAQDEKQLNFKMTLDEVIELAQKQSLDAFRSKNMYLADYWRFRSFKAEMLPSLNLNTSPFTYSKGILSYRDNEGNKKYKYLEAYQSNGRLSLDQQIKYTGGELSLVSRADYEYNKDAELANAYFASPILSAKYTQNNIKYNALKWRTKLEPLAYKKAKLDYLSNAEGIASRSVTYFFALVKAQITKNIAETNYSNADTLHRIAKGRFEIGTITQDELLDLELGLLNAETRLTRSNLTLQRAQKILNTFLRMDQEIIIECIVPAEIPRLDIDFDQALAKAQVNNPLIKEIKYSNIQANRDVASSKAQRGFTGSFSIEYGLTSSEAQNEYLPIYDEPNRYENANISLRIPILDWGVRKGNYLQAKSNREVTKLENEQRWIAFEQDLFMDVMSFNIQDEQVKIAAKADTVAKMGYKVTKQRFFIDKVDVIRLNEARKSLEEARGQYIDALRTYWNYYYTIRQQTLYDFDKAKPLMADFDKILEETTY